MTLTHAAQAPVLASPVKARRDYLDGLRGLAALFIVAHHLWLSHTGGALPGFSGALRNWLLYGHLSVDVFIVLSGACLMLPVTRFGSLRGGWQTFTKSRARRILPPLYFAMALAWAAHSLTGKAFSPHTLLVNVLLLQDVMPKENVLDLPLWSVALEWRIYFLFPLFVWLWSRYGSPAVLAFSALLGYGLAALFGVVYPALPLAHACPWYLFLFGMGMAATDIAMRPARFKWLLPLLFPFAVICLAWMLHQWPITAAGEGRSPYLPHLPLIDAAVGAVTAFALMLLSEQSARQNRSLPIKILSWKPLVFVGTIGYSIYLIHITVIFEIKHLLISHLHLHSNPAIIAADLAVTVGVAYLFHLAFERPFMSKAGKPAPRTEREAETAAVEPSIPDVSRRLPASSAGTHNPGRSRAEHRSGLTPRRGRHPC